MGLKLLGVAPSGTTDATTKSYVDTSTTPGNSGLTGGAGSNLSVAAGAGIVISSGVAVDYGNTPWKPMVRAATTANGTLSTAYANGQAIDGVTLATGDRILIKDQTTGSENGIYTVNSSGAPTRASDFDSTGDAANGAVVEVLAGTVNANTIWNLSNTSAPTLGTTALTFVAGVTGLWQSGSLKVGSGASTFDGPVTITPDSLTDGATITIDASTGNHFRVTLGGNRTMAAPTNPTDAQLITLEVIQDGTGSRTLTWNSVFAFGTDVPSPTLTTTASKRDFLSFKYNSTAVKWYCLGVVKGY